MPDAKSPPDLSMDEILSTIRRMIAEDEQAIIPPAAAHAGSHSAGAANDAAPGDPADRHDDDVLELTDALNEDGTVRRLAPIGSLSQAAAAPREAADADAGGLPEPGAAEPRGEPHPAAAEPPSAPEAPRPEAASEPEPPRLVTSTETAPAAPDPELPRAEPPNPPPATAGSGAGVMSEAASDAAAAAFTRLASAPRPASESPPIGERPLEEVVREQLRPMLQSWLDANLPQLVERLVEAEIARVVRRSGAD